MPVNQYSDSPLLLEIETGEETFVLLHHVASSAASRAFLMGVATALMESEYGEILVEVSGDTKLVVSERDRRVVVENRPRNGGGGSVLLKSPDNVTRQMPRHPEVVAGFVLASLALTMEEHVLPDMNNPAAHFVAHELVRGDMRVAMHRMHGDAVEIDTLTQSEGEEVRLEVHIGVDARRAAVLAAHAPDATCITISADDIDGLECGPSSTVWTTITVDQAHSLLKNLEGAIADAVSQAN